MCCIFSSCLLISRVALILAWWLSASRPPLTQRDSTALTAINELMAKAFAEVEEQEIPCTNAKGRMISPLDYTSQCVDRSIYACELLMNLFRVPCLPFLL
jgi:hypothetical protein